ncbi:hypothetical protein VCCP1050_1296, partial [Vibrio cholerae CP1050(23)]
MKRSVNS